MVFPGGLLSIFSFNAFSVRDHSCVWIYVHFLTCLCKIVSQLVQISAYAYIIVACFLGFFLLEPELGCLICLTACLSNCLYFIYVIA